MLYANFLPKMSGHLKLSSFVILSFVQIFLCGVVSATPVDEEDPAVARFREYLKINKAVQPNPDYQSSIDWIKSQAEEIGLEYNIFKFQEPKLFEIVLTWRGTDQSLKSIFCISHIDVVAVKREKWIHEPFAAEKDKDGNIFARGTQDTRGVGAWYLEAIRRLKKAGVRPLRNVHIGFSPDEERGGVKGLKQFVTTPDFKNLNAGFALDEGSISDGNYFHLVWAERAMWHVTFTAEGTSGHGSILHNNTAAEKISKVIEIMLDARQKEKHRLETEDLELGAVNTINLDVMKGGNQNQINVVPSEFSVSFDIRISPYTSLDEITALLENVTAEAGPGVTYKFVTKDVITDTTPLTEDNIWWKAVREVANETGIEFRPTIMNGASDLRFLRHAGVPGFGFSPISNTTVLLHGDNEYLNEKTYLRGIEIYEKLLPKLFNMK